MSGIKLLIADYTRAVAQYQRTDRLSGGQCTAYATRAAGAALAIALRSTEHHAVWREISAEWAQRAQPHGAAVG
jgi:hypothetical protein